MTVKPWQKATLSVMAGTTIYAGLLYALTEKTQQQNKASFRQREPILAQEKALEVTFQEKRAELVALEKQLQSVLENTAKVEDEIKAVNTQISEIKAGHISGSSLSTPPTTVSAVTTPSVSVPNIQPPAVQSVTKAS